MSRSLPWSADESAEVAARALDRIADTLDDYMEMSLSAQEVIQGVQATDPAMTEYLVPLLTVLRGIRERRATR